MTENKENGEQSPELRTKKTVILFFIFLLIIAIFFSVLYYIYDRSYFEESKKQIMYREPAEKTLGFETGTPYINNYTKEVFMITDVYVNGSMDRAGAMVGDRITAESIGIFFEEIYQAQRTNYSFDVERNGTRFTITVYVPPFEANEYKDLGYGSMCLLGVTIPALIIIAILLFYARLLTKANLINKKEIETERDIS